MPIEGCPDFATKEYADSIKNEIQELRDQLNEVLGKDESGETTQVFTAGVGSFLW